MSIQIVDDYDPFVEDEVSSRRRNRPAIERLPRGQGPPEHVGVRCGSCRGPPGDGRPNTGRRAYSPRSAEVPEQVSARRPEEPAGDIDGGRSVIKVSNKASFDQVTNLMREEEMPAMALFHVKWCGHCTRYKADLERELPRIGSKMAIISVDHEEAGGFDPTERLPIQAYPTVLMFDGDEWRPWQKRGDFDGMMRFADRVRGN